jgi:hypothetical protein
MLTPDILDYLPEALLERLHVRNQAPLALDDDI